MPAIPSRKRPIQPSSVKEQRLIEDVVRGKKGTATDALHRVNELRRKHGIRGIGKDAVYRFVRGATHPRTTAETRGANDHSPNLTSAS